VSISRHQAVGAYRRWEPEDFDAPAGKGSAPPPEAFAPGALLAAAALAPPQHPPDFAGPVADEATASPKAFAGYPASSSAATALPVADPSPSISADPTATDFTFTPGTTARALVTACTQCPQVMPSMASVVVRTF